MAKLNRENEKIKWTQRTMPGETRRSRRITLSVTPAMADRLVMLARLDGVSVNHEVELMADAEYTRRLENPNSAALIRAFENVQHEAK
jgi:hypothetical protein